MCMRNSVLSPNQPNYILTGNEPDAYIVALPSIQVLCSNTLTSETWGRSIISLGCKV
jgi:hypothetical protein